MSYYAGYDPRQGPPPPQHGYGHPAAPPPGYAAPPQGYGPPQGYAAPQGYAGPQSYAPQPGSYSGPPGASAPLFSPSSLQQSSSSPSHQLGGSSAAKIAGGAASTGMRDKWWLLLFLLHIVFVFIVEGVYGSRFVNSFSGGSVPSDSDTSQAEKMVIGMLVTAAVVGTLFAALWLKAMKIAKGKLIVTSVVGNVVFAIVAAGWFFSKNISGYGVSMLLWAGILAFWVWWHRARIPMAEATLASSSQSVSDVWGPFIVTYGVAIFNVVWTINWGFSILAVLVCKWTTSLSTNQTFESAAVVILLFSYYWTGQVVRNIVHFTTAGTVSSWWLVSEVSSPTMGALKRSLTTSIGTICVGSLVVAAIQFLVLLARSAKLVCFCCIRLLERAVRWFNKYAMVLSSMYGYSYFEAAKAVRQLMAAAFWELLVTNTLTSAVFVMGNFMAGILAAAVSLVWTAVLSSSDTNYESYQSFMPFFCFIIGYQMSSLFMAVLDSAVSTTLVCWAEDPLSMQRNRPDQFAALTAAAQLQYPTEYANAFPGLMAQQVQVQPQLPYYQPPSQYNAYQPPPHNF